MCTQGLEVHTDKRLAILEDIGRGHGLEIAVKLCNHQ